MCSLESRTGPRNYRLSQELSLIARAFNLQVLLNRELRQIHYLEQLRDTRLRVIAYQYRKMKAQRVELASMAIGVFEIGELWLLDKHFTEEQWEVLAADAIKFPEPYEGFRAKLQVVREAHRSRVRRMQLVKEDLPAKPEGANAQYENLCVKFAQWAMEQYQEGHLVVLGTAEHNQENWNKVTEGLRRSIVVDDGFREKFANVKRANLGKSVTASDIDRVEQASPKAE